MFLQSFPLTNFVLVALLNFIKINNPLKEDKANLDHLGCKTKII